jgi:hypothetical protein
MKPFELGDLLVLALDSVGMTVILILEVGEVLAFELGKTGLLGLKRRKVLSYELSKLVILGRPWL